MESLKTRINFKYLLIFLGIILIFVIGFAAGKGKQDTGVLSSFTQKISPSPTPSPNSLGTLYKVAQVTDGDTIDVLIDGNSKAVRLIGIDTPEVVDPRKPVECFGEQASNEAKSILTGKSVYLKSDPSQGDTDKYKRLLRYVFLQSGTNFNLMMISDGFAHEYTYDTPYKFQTKFKAAEKTAMQKGVGLWAPNTCDGNTGTSSSPIPTSSSTTGTSTSVHEVINTNNSTTEIIQQTSTSPSQVITGGSGSYTPTGTYSCDCSKQCGQIKTCDEAYYQLQNCGCSARDSDGDGIPCESLCR